MGQADQGSEPRAAGRRSRTALVRYAAGWIAVSALLVVAAVILRQDPEQPPWMQAGAATAPPPRTASLRAAVDASGCTLQRVRRQGNDDLIRRPTDPPTFGPPVPRSARPGVYARAPRVFEVVGALREGNVVIQFRSRLGDDDLRLLRAVHDESPDRTLLMPDRRGMPYDVAVTAWRRLLGCRIGDDDVIDAVRAFRARFRGQGPES